MAHSLYTKTCPTCHIQFTANHYTKIYCSVACRPAIQKLICDQCGKEYFREKSSMKHCGSRFCSWTCRTFERGKSAHVRFKEIMGEPPADSSQCWIWKGRLTDTGYGKLFDKGKERSAHRVAYEIFHGPITPGLHVLHKCIATRACCLPQHLYQGTNDDNIRDMVTQGRTSHGAKHYKAKLTEQQVIKMRAMVARGVLQKTIAKQLSVSRSTVSGIILGKEWKHLL